MPSVFAFVFLPFPSCVVTDVKGKSPMCSQHFVSVKPHYQVLNWGMSTKSTSIGLSADKDYLLVAILEEIHNSKSQSFLQSKLLMGNTEKKIIFSKHFPPIWILKILAVTVKRLSLTKHAHVNHWKNLLTALKDSQNPETASSPTTTNQVFVSQSVLAC